MRRTLCLLFLFGCAAKTGDGGMIVLSNSAATTDMCSFTADPNEPFISSGTIVLTSPAPYLLTPLIESKIDAIMGQELQQTIEFRGAKIDIVIETIQTHAGTTTNSYTFDSSELSMMHDEGITHFQSLFSGTLGPKAFANVSFDIVPLALLDAIATKIAGDSGTLSALLKVTIVIFGDLGGDEVDGDQFVYPVTVCTNCVVNPLGTCPAKNGTMVRAGNPCNPFQDGVVDCCLMGNQLVCPAPVATM
jgi:hypothetical protein